MLAMRLTPELLAAALQMPLARAALHALAMQPALELAEINTPLRLAHWLGQVGHETGRLRYLREIWGPTSAQLRYERILAAPWPADAQQARRPAYARNRLAYSLGNTQPGDGARYKGRGGIQTTGRGNYRRLTQRLRDRLGSDVPNFEGAPGLVETPQWAHLAAADYWLMRGLNTYADTDDLATLTRRVNGGTNGLADRQAIKSLALAAILME